MSSSAMIGGSIAIKSGGGLTPNSLTRGGDVSLAAAAAAMGGNVDITAGDGIGKFIIENVVAHRKCAVICLPLLFIRLNEGVDRRQHMDPSRKWNRIGW